VARAAHKIADVNVDFRTIAEELESGEFRRRLREELSAGFREMAAAGDRPPPASYYATKIVEVIHAQAPVPFSKEAAFDLYQEALLACEEARAEVLGEEGES
jgi:hypothetical protein